MFLDETEWSHSFAPGKRYESHKVGERSSTDLFQAQVCLKLLAAHLDMLLPLRQILTAEGSNSAKGL